MQSTIAFLPSLETRYLLFHQHFNNMVLEKINPLPTRNSKLENTLTDQTNVEQADLSAHRYNKYKQG